MSPFPMRLPQPRFVPRFVAAWGAVFAVALFLGAGGLRAQDELRIAKDFYHAQRYKDAWDNLQTALSKDPNSVEANHYAGLIHMETKQLSRARTFFLKALEGDPLHKEAAENAIETLRREARGSPARAKLAYEFPIRKYGLFLGPLVLDLIKIYIQTNDGRAVISTADKMVEKVSAGEYQRRYSREGAEALLLAAKVAFRAGELRQSSDYVNSARSLNGGIEGLREMTDRIESELERRAAPHRDRGDTHALRGEYEEALAAYKKALDLYPGWQAVKGSILSVSNLQEAVKLFEEAQGLEAAGQVVPALAKYSRAVAKLPEDARLANRIASLRERMVERQAALEEKDKDRRDAERKKQADFAAAFDRAEAAQVAGRWVDAEKAWEEALGYFPDKEDVRKSLAEAREKAKIERRFEEGVKAFRAEKYRDALEALEDVLKLDGSIENLKRYLALTYFKLERYEDARVHGEQFLEVSPRNKEMNYVLGVIHHRAVVAGEEGPRTALAYFEKVDDEYYNDVGDRLSDLRWRLNRVPVIGASIALALWIAAIFWKKQRPKILKNTFLGKIEKYAAKENWKALSKMEEEARRYPLDRTQDLAVSTALAQAFYHLQDWQKAISWANLALGNSRENPDLILLLGRIYFEGQIISQETLRYLVALAKEEPDNVELAKFIAEFCLDKQVLNDDTMPILRSLALQMPEHDKLRRMLIRGYLRNEDKSARAMALYRVELEKSPDNIDLRYMVAFDCMKNGRTEECIKHCEEIINNKLNHPGTHDLLRQAYAKLGKSDDLARIYQGILEADPYNPAVQESLKKILDGEDPLAADAGGEGSRKCPKCGKPVKVKQYYCICGQAL